MGKRRTSQYKTSLFSLNRGFTLVEVLIAVGLLAIVSLGIAQLISNSSKQQRGLMAKDQLRDVSNEISSVLQNRPSCLNTFSGQVATTNFSVNAIKDGAGASLFSIGQEDKSKLLKYADFSFKDFTLDAGFTNQGRASLIVKMTKTGETLSVPDIVKTLTLKVKINPATGQIIECYYIGTNSDGYWQPSPANSNDIFYSGGRVGIGNPNPASILDVVGDLTLNGNIIQTGVFSIKNNSDTYLDSGTGDIYIRPGGASSTVFKQGGNVGLGVMSPTVRLDVAGGAKFTGTVTAPTFATVSDQTLKENINTLEDPLGLVKQIRGVSFEWKDSHEKDIGFIAQEVRKIVPELTTENEQGLLAVKYSNMSALLLEAFKQSERQRQKDKENYDQRLKELEKQIQEIKKSVSCER